VDEIAGIRLEAMRLRELVREAIELFLVPDIESFDNMAANEKAWLEKARAAVEKA
jgi:hypothetical protein